MALAGAPPHQQLTNPHLPPPPPPALPIFSSQPHVFPSQLQPDGRKCNCTAVISRDRMYFDAWLLNSINHGCYIDCCSALSNLSTTRAKSDRIDDARHPGFHAPLSHPWEAPMQRTPHAENRTSSTGSKYLLVIEAAWGQNRFKEGWWQA